MKVKIRAGSASRFRELAQMLSTDSQMIVRYEMSGGNNSSEEEGTDADVFVWELETPEEFEWYPLDEKQFASGNLVLIVDAPSEEWIEKMSRSGVNAVLPANISADGLAAAIRAVAAGLFVRTGIENAGITGAIPYTHLSMTDPLTSRELDVLTAMADGLTNKSIASRLRISEHTVKFHVATILSKLGASSRTEAVTLAIRQGLLMI